MTTHARHYSKKTLVILGILLLIPPLYIQFVWMNTNSNLSQQYRVEQFLEQFPGFLQNGKLLALLSLAFCILCIICVTRSFNQRTVYVRVICILAAIVASLIGLMNIFQLM